MTAQDRLGGLKDRTGWSELFMSGGSRACRCVRRGACNGQSPQWWNTI